jgi:hypothetical protein
MRLLKHNTTSFALASSAVSSWCSKGPWAESTNPEPMDPHSACKCFQCVRLASSLLVQGSTPLLYSSLLCPLVITRAEGTALLTSISHPCNTRFHGCASLAFIFHACRKTVAVMHGLMLRHAAHSWLIRSRMTVAVYHVMCSCKPP